jgi:hypothetical protein
MAIAPSKLGEFVQREGTSDEILLDRLREVGLVRADVADADITATFQAARDEHEAGGRSPYNSPEERVRVFLEPYLTDKGRAWADPLKRRPVPDGWISVPVPSSAAVSGAQVDSTFRVVRRRRDHDD